MPKSNLKEVAESFESFAEATPEPRQRLTAADFLARPGESNGERHAHLAGFVKSAAGRRPNMLRRKTVVGGDVFTDNQAAAMNMRISHSAGSQASKCDTWEDAVNKIDEYDLETEEWNYLDEVTDEFVQVLMKSAGVKDTGLGTRASRAAHRAAVLAKSEDIIYPTRDGERLEDKGLSFESFVQDFLHADTGAPESTPKSNGEKKTRGVGIG